MNEIQLIKQGTSVLQISVPNIKKINVEKLKLVPQIKKTDIYLFRQYLLALENNTKVTPDEIKELFSFDGEEFETKAYEFLVKKLNIPETVKPPIMVIPAIVANAHMMYVPSNNIIYINRQNKISDKATYLSVLRHEFQHYMQNMQILRSEELGENAVAYYTEELSKLELQNCDYTAKNFTLEQIRQQGVSEEGMVIYRELKNLLNQGKINEYEQKLRQVGLTVYNQIFAQWSEIRKNAIDKMGIIQKDTKAWKRAEKFFNDFHSSYYTEDNKVDLVSYCLKCTENEAVVAQNMLLSNVTGEKLCCIKEMKKGVILASGDEQIKDEQLTEIKNFLDNKKEEIKAQKISFEYLLSYLFD